MISFFYNHENTPFKNKKEKVFLIFKRGICISTFEGYSSIIKAFCNVSTIKSNRTIFIFLALHPAIMKVSITQKWYS